MISIELYKDVARMVKSKSTCKKEEALKEYMRLIVSLSGKYVRAGVDRDDVIMAGVVGLMEAVESFDPSRSDNFGAHAKIRICARMFEYSISERSVLHVPINIAKASTYVELMYNLLDSEAILFTNDVDPMEVIQVFNHPIEKELPETVRHRLIDLKRKFNNLAGNSLTEYSVLVSRALMGMTTHESDAILEQEETCAPSCDNLEKEVIIREKRDRIKEQVPPKQYRAVELRFMGYNYEEIADKLYEEKLTENKVSRTAVRNMIESTKDLVKTMEE